MQIDPTRLHKLTTGALGKIAPVQVDAPPAAETRATTAAAGADRLELSQRAAEVQAAHQALAQTPEVRAEQIAALKAQMAAGTYHVNPENIASKMIPD